MLVSVVTSDNAGGLGFMNMVRFFLLAVSGVYGLQSFECLDLEDSSSLCSQHTVCSGGVKCPRICQMS